MKLLTVIGARPQIIKAAALSRAIQENFANEIDELIVHTGQHYDEAMSSIFFDELKIPKPAYNLNVGSGNHGEQTAKMLAGIEELILKEKPNAVVVYGDTNSTVAAGLAASKLHVPLVHIESGLRSFNKKMPEEINRILCDHMSTLLFVPTLAGIDNLRREGIAIRKKGSYSADEPGVFHCGDIMYDNSLHFANQASVDWKKKLDIEGEFALLTVHRDTNTDDNERFTSILESLIELTAQENLTVVWPVHPRAKKMMNTIIDSSLVEKVVNNPRLKLIEPVSFLEIIGLESQSTIILTDSGGLQKEAYFFKKPCLILRDQTEWVEIVENGCALLTGADKNKILEGYQYFKNIRKTLHFPEVFGDGKAGVFIAKTILKTLQ